VIIHITANYQVIVRIHRLLCHNCVGSIAAD